MREKRAARDLQLRQARKGKTTIEHRKPPTENKAGGGGKERVIKVQRAHAILWGSVPLECRYASQKNQVSSASPSIGSNWGGKSSGWGFFVDRGKARETCRGGRKIVHPVGSF